MKYLLFLPFLIGTAALAQEPDSTSALFKMREAERNFAKESVTIGRNESFAKNFAEESVIFTDKWITNGKQFSKERKPTPVVLKWEPEFMDIAASRDFGISNGPWEVQEYRPNTSPLATGYFLTVWKKQSDGIWMVILDGGSETPVVNGAKHTFTFPEGADKPIANPPEMNEELLKKDLLKKDNQIKGAGLDSLTSFFTSNARVQLNKHLPAGNADTIKVLNNKLDRSLIWQVVGAGAASSGDMGFTYGVIKATDILKGHYVRIWKKQPGSEWRIEIEMINVD